MRDLNLNDADDFAELERRVGTRAARAIRFGLAYGITRKSVTFRHMAKQDVECPLTAADYAAIGARIFAAKVKQ